MPASPVLPSRLQSTLSTLLLLGLSLLLAPASFAVAAFFSLTHPSSTSRSKRQHRGRAIQGRRPKTVLINGARMQKSLAACRAFGRQGWRVVLVEERGWGNLASARFSNSVSAFHLIAPSSLPARDGGKRTPYIEALLDVARREDVDLFFPCSGAGSTGQDAEFADLLLTETGGKVRSIIQSPELVETLHEKDKFITLLDQLELPAPRSDIVYSVKEALDTLRQPGYPLCILKCAAELDDVGRADLTTYPLTDAKSGRADWAATERRLSNLPIPLCDQTPYILQEFIGDRDPAQRASEWCTHATVIDGEMTAFVCCPSNDMLMTYHPAGNTHIGRLALEWTHSFLERLRALSERDGSEWPRHRLLGRDAPEQAGITGAFSMDFIYQPATADGSSPERLVAIECNPRVHTAICLLSGYSHLADALTPSSLRSSEVVHRFPVMEQAPARDVDLFASSSSPRRPAGLGERFGRAKNLIQLAYADRSNLSKSWIGHDLPARILPALLPRWVDSLTSRVHPLWRPYAALALKDQKSLVAIPAAAEDGEPTKAPRSTVFDLDMPAVIPPLTDPSFAKDDPWPYFALYHLQWPQLLLWQLLVRRNKWSRINVSTARIFEC
ncbi:uncharacterized protein PFL1_03731 [Pseudozyma flocculosa PF-1]|uniref:ATP-grasp domain-containing protein n=2 Tax=Pseudozyma flocculosa TaxID=84751 RepID=A0A5C3F3A3_9BASI|nr:uncharacterized protein PFL1_03731 [Pseudozyma flocculosa PF-1]EPQ28931.1 hypothetical protein PFL1_03731 [Pseudozyma flocculosa PF-1]SPO38580.1 uncharacterized protein PSFLO_04058 [Pseudozyma flocculosa]